MKLFKCCFCAWMIFFLVILSFSVLAGVVPFDQCVEAGK